MYLTGLIPARFLICVFHLILTIVAIMARDDSVLACLRKSYVQLEYDSLDIQIIVATVMSFVLFLLEFISFIWAFSVTNQWQNLFSMLCHFAGVILLSFYLFNGWCSSRFWFVFGFCCLPPAITELTVWICNGLIKKQT